MCACVFMYMCVRACVRVCVCVGACVCLDVCVGVWVCGCCSGWLCWTLLMAFNVLDQVTYDLPPSDEGTITEYSIYYRAGESFVCLHVCVCLRACLCVGDGTYWRATLRA